MKTKDPLLLKNTITQNPVLAKRARFWHVASHIASLSCIFIVGVGWGLQNNKIRRPSLYM